jgi:hypothetical protein
MVALDESHVLPSVTPKREGKLKAESADGGRKLVSRK